jgi:transcriptional regulator with XRE-family HTH domain
VETNTDGEFKASVVGAYERGERAISVQRFSRLAEIYGTPASELLPAPTDPELVIDLDQLSVGEGDLVERYLAAIQILRKSPGVEEVRESDRIVISSLLSSAPVTPRD